MEGTLSETYCPMGEVSYAGTLEVPLNMVEKAVRLDLTVKLAI